MGGGLVTIVAPTIAKTVESNLWCPLIFFRMVQYNNRVFVLGHKYVLGPTLEPEKGPKHIYAQEHKLYYY